MLSSHVSLVCEGLPASGRRIMHVGPFSALDEEERTMPGPQNPWLR